MKRFTQTITPGNCWQTAIACILEVEPAELPDQVLIESAGASYLNALNAYLEKHHGLMYTELQDYQIAAVVPRHPGFHVMVGPSVRTTPDTGILHAVVGLYGEIEWDPHPSRAGLISVDEWGIFSKIPPRILEMRNGWRSSGGSMGASVTCHCPRC